MRLFRPSIRRLNLSGTPPSTSLLLQSFKEVRLDATVPSTFCFPRMRSPSLFRPMQYAGHATCFASGARRGWIGRAPLRCFSVGHARTRPRRPWGQIRRLSSEKGGDGNESKQQQPVAATKPHLLPRLPVVHENIYTVPNILTFSRLLSAPAIGYLILTSQHGLALSLFAYAGVTDLVDGYIARRYKQTTVVGTIIDPMADKTLMTIGVVCLAVRGDMPVWLAVLILARDVGLALAAIYYRWISLPHPKTMARYWDFSLPSAEVHPTGVSKANTALQLLLVGASMAVPVLPDAWMAAVDVGVWMGGLQYLVAITTVWSGASYVYSKDAVKILTRGEIEERQKEKGKGKGKEK